MTHLLTALAIAAGIAVAGMIIDYKWRRQDHKARLLPWQRG